MSDLMSEFSCTVIITYQGQQLIKKNGKSSIIRSHQNFELDYFIMHISDCDAEERMKRESFDFLDIDSTKELKQRGEPVYILGYPGWKQCTCCKISSKCKCKLMPAGSECSCKTGCSCDEAPGLCMCTNPCHHPPEFCECQHPLSFSHGNLKQKEQKMRMKYDLDTKEGNSGSPVSGAEYSVEGIHVSTSGNLNTAQCLKAVLEDLLNILNEDTNASARSATGAAAVKIPKSKGFLSGLFFSEKCTLDDNETEKEEREREEKEKLIRKREATELLQRENFTESETTELLQKEHFTEREATELLQRENFTEREATELLQRDNKKREIEQTEEIIRKRERDLEEREESVKRMLITNEGEKQTGDIENGIGTYTWSSGAKYSGSWKDGKKHGQGSMVYPSGGKYIGEYKDNEKHGQGLMIHSSGWKYIGEYKDGKKDGQGIKTMSDGAKYSGMWKDDTYHGLGTYVWENGIKYIGEWRDHKKNGLGIEVWPSGGQYIGEWENDKQHGQGTKMWTSGAKYSGGYKDGLKHGQGTLISANGTEISGVWQNGERQ